MVDEAEGAQDEHVVEQRVRIDSDVGSCLHAHWGRVRLDRMRWEVEDGRSGCDPDRPASALT